MAQALCGKLVKSKRSLLALGWTVVNALAFIAFLTAFTFAMSAKNLQNAEENGNENDENEEDREDEDRTFSVAVTSRAMAFSALWTAVLASTLCIFGTVILGFQSPMGKYYWCCSLNVHMTTELVLGAFIGALLMFANLTLVCSVLFGEFQVCNSIPVCTFLKICGLQS